MPPVEEVRNQSVPEREACSAIEPAKQYSHAQTVGAARKRSRRVQAMAYLA